VLSGSAIVPAPIVTITETDHESLVSLVATKYNSLIPDTGSQRDLRLFIQGAAHLQAFRALNLPMFSRSRVIRGLLAGPQMPTVA